MYKYKNLKYCNRKKSNNTTAIDTVIKICWFSILNNKRVLGRAGMPVPQVHKMVNLIFLTTS
ncbi:hypothetical protein DSM106972_028490 [Dulcicalothrix desertica PCC 7102]|uniref:Uncharacterized protein n=1 Tax=Dulcicalothrix desertica PCC 7102 TaxID=232991 RepID=A0A3S1AQ08_9CYAN|nr:hypothetical protein DSM106972_028490 [Dulcicalothrix desertica PCC 7102]